MHAIEAREQRNALGAALLMHGLLVAGLLLSISWSPKQPPVVQVELWGSPPADRPAKPVAVQPPAPTPRPQPAPPPVQPKADISVQKKPEPPKPKPEEQAKRNAEKKEAQQREAIRKAELARLLNTDNNAKPSDQGKDIATKAGAAQGAEIGAKTGVDADYIALIQTRIRARITYADRTPGNPEAIVTVDQLPSGEITRVQLTKSSGIPAWDQAVQRAIWAASPLPKKQDGTVVRTLELRLRPRETP